jgi:hypothetical protein
MTKTRGGKILGGLLCSSSWTCWHLFWWVALFGAWSASAQVTPPDKISLTLSWLMADPQPESFFTKGYLLTRFIPGNTENVQNFIPDHSPNPEYRFTYSDLAPDTTYAFRCETVCGVETNAALEMNSEFIAVTFSTGSIVPGDVRPPVVSVDYANEVIPAHPLDPGFQAIYSWSTNVTITGTVVDESHLTLQISGDATVRSMAFQGTGGVWVASLSLKNIGTNLISIHATDFFTNNTLTNIVVVNLGLSNTASISPNFVSEDYDGWLSLQVNGEAVAQPVLVEKFLDVNGNGVVDAGDLLCQSITITDGSIFDVGGIPFPTVPGDNDAVANGRIYGSIDFQSQSELNRMAANYIFHIIDSSGQFNEIALPMRVLQRASEQKIAGRVTAGGLPVPGALVFYSTPPDTNWIGGVVTDSGGNYAILCKPGVHAVAAFKNGYVCNLDWTSQTMVNPGIDSIVNPVLLAADRLIQGALSDSDARLGGQQLFAHSADGWSALTTSDAQGNFNLPVLAASYSLLLSSKSLSMAGLIGLKNNPVVNTLTGDVSGLDISLTKPNAVVFGAIRNSHFEPVGGISINAAAANLPWSSTSIPSDSDGLYAIGITAGEWAAGPNPIDLIQHGYAVSVWPVVSPTNGQAIYYEFTAIQATAFLSGLVVDDTGTPIQGITVEAVDSANYGVSTTTDAAGAFRIGVSSGLWTLRISASDTHANLYSSPLIPIQMVDGENQADIKMTLYRISGQLSGTVLDVLNRPISDVHILATLYQTDIYSTYYAIGLTDSDGRYVIDISSGLWRLELPDLNPDVYIAPAPRDVQMDGESLSENYTISLNAPLGIATAVLNNAHPGLAFSQQLIPYGGQPPYIWTPASTSPALPPGLELSPEGVLGGIPSSQGSFPFTVHLSDASSNSVEQAFTLIVSTAPLMRLQAIGYQDTGGFVLRAMGVMGINCLVQVSENFINWTTLLRTNSLADSFDFEDNSLSHNTIRFYRLEEGN